MAKKFAELRAKMSPESRQRSKKIAREMLRKVGYVIQLDFDPDEKVWVARSPSFPGLVAAGKTERATILRFFEFMAEW